MIRSIAFVFVALLGSSSVIASEIASQVGSDADVPCIEAETEVSHFDLSNVFTAKVLWRALPNDWSPDDGLIGKLRLRTSIEGASHIIARRLKGQGKPRTLNAAEDLGSFRDWKIWAGQPPSAIEWTIEGKTGNAICRQTIRFHASGD